MSETQRTIGEWLDALAPAPSREVGVRAQAVKLLGEAAELAMAAGVSANDCYLALVQATNKVQREEGIGHFTSLPFDAAKVAKESADCNVVNNVLAHRAGFDLADETAAVMTRNRSRSWDVSPEGMAQHVPAEGDR